MTDRSLEKPAQHIQKTALATLIGLALWASLTRIDEAVMAAGSVVTPDRLQVVQIPDGGIVSALYVKEGDQVAEGELLASLEKERADAATGDLKTQQAALQLNLLRAQAEATGQALTTPPLARRYPSLWIAQWHLFDERKQAIDQDLQAFDKAIELATEEQGILHRLADSGDISPTELMRSERGLLELVQRRASVRSNARVEASREVTRLGAELASVEQRIREREDVLNRTDLYAPVAGTIQSVRLKTPGAVLRSGEEFIHIAPATPANLVELKVNPTDIGRLRTGMKAKVKLDAWDYSIYGSLAGVVTSISPDVVTEQAYPHNQIWYRVMLEVSNDPANSKLGIEQMKSGMHATADILTGDRSLLWYLSSPITRAFAGSLKER